MTEQHDHPTREYKTQAEVDELLKDAPVWRKPGDLAFLDFFADDAEHQEFLVWLRETRQRGMT